MRTMIYIPQDIFNIPYLMLEKALLNQEYARQNKYIAHFELPSVWANVSLYNI